MTQYLKANANDRYIAHYSITASTTGSPIVLPNVDRMANGNLEYRGRQIAVALKTTGTAKVQLTLEDPESFSANSIWVDWERGSIQGSAVAQVIEGPVTAIRLWSTTTSATAQATVSA